MKTEVCFDCVNWIHETGGCIFYVSGSEDCKMFKQTAEGDAKRSNELTGDAKRAEIICTYWIVTGG